MAGLGFHNAIKWFIIVYLIIAVMIESNTGSQYLNIGNSSIPFVFNFGVALALIYLILRSPLEYSRTKK